MRRELKHLFEIETRLRRENEKMFILQVALEMCLRGYELSPSDVYCEKKESTDLKDFVNRMNNLSFK